MNWQIQFEPYYIPLNIMIRFLFKTDSVYILIDHESVITNDRLLILNKKAVPI